MTVATNQRFTLSQPLDTHFRPATCEEVDCPQHLFGWVTVLDRECDVRLIDDILKSGRHFTRMRSEEASQRASKDLPPGMLAFVFPPGQQCFRQHVMPVGREPFLAYQRGVAMGAGGAFVPVEDRRQHVKVSDFTEHFNEEADGIRRRRQAG